MVYVCKNTKKIISTANKANPRFYGSISTHLGGKLLAEILCSNLLDVSALLRTGR
jgi:hypothetical protein